MNVEVEAAAEALDHDERTGVAIGDAAPAGLTAVEVQEYADVDAEPGAAEAVVPREEIAQPVGQAEDPLPHGDAGQHAVHGAGSGSVTRRPPLLGQNLGPLPEKGTATALDALPPWSGSLT